MNTRSSESRQSCVDHSNLAWTKALFLCVSGVAWVAAALSLWAPETPGSRPVGLYHGTAYYPELWPEAEVERDIAEMQKLGLNVARMGEFAWATMEPNEGQISMAFFKRVMDKLHAAGIKVILCTPTATPPVWLTHGHPERAFVDANGVVMVHGARQHVSYEEPAVRQACVRIVEAMARELGRHPSLIAWQIDNELKCHVAEDYSDAAVASWHRWLKGRYGTVERLNDTWGTDIWSQRYQNFEQVPAPKKTPFLHNASLSTAYRLFNREAIAEFMDSQSAIIRRHSEAPITHNMSEGFSIHLERMSRDLDFVSFDGYPSAGAWHEVVFACDLWRGAKPGKPFWFMETSTSHNGWLGNNTEIPHPPGFLVAEAVCCYASGAEGISYWLWRQPRTGAELPHSAVMSAWFKPGIGYESVRAVEEARRQLEPLLTATRPAPAEVGITWSDRGRAMLQTEAIGAGRGTSVDHKARVMEWQRLFLDAGIHRELRFEGAALDGLKLLVTPAMPAVDEVFMARLRPWVEAGGSWICVSPSGTRTVEHTVPTNAGLGLVDEFAGVETVYGFPANGTEAKGEAFGQSAPLQGWCSALKPVTAETKAIGSLKTALLDSELAFITERQLGKGAVVVVGAHPGGDAGWNMRAKLVEHYAAQAGVTQRYSVSQGTVVVPRVRTDGTALWMVVNLDGKGGRIELPQGAKDAISGVALPGEVQLARYGWRAIGLPSDGKAEPQEPPDELLARIPENFTFAAQQYEGMLASIADPKKLPRTTEQGKVKLVGANDWTSGFFPGSLWFIYEHTRDPQWLVAASNWTARVESAKDHRGDHDVGFMIGCSFGNGWRLTTNAAYREVMVHAARTLSLRCKPEVGLIRSWDFGPWKYPVIVDNMMNLELLCFAARESGEARLRDLAISHADHTRQDHFRADFSSYHVVDYNPTNGTVRGKQTAQGAADDSTWARGQAWGLYGFTMMFRETHKPEYLARATNIANFILNHPRLPADKIPYWDFDAPGIPDAPRDASAAAIMASALIELSTFAEGEAGASYLALARQQLLSLSSPAYRAKPGENGGFILMHSVGNKPGNVEVDVPLNYADYYFLEALLRYRDLKGGS